jgi:hypothetical protein
MAQVSRTRSLTEEEALTYQAALRVLRVNLQQLEKKLEKLENNEGGD